jgi:hypothetical protein
LSRSAEASYEILVAQSSARDPETNSINALADTLKMDGDQ